MKKVLAQQPSREGSGAADTGTDIVLSGKRFTLPHSRQQIIEFLLSAYEAAVIQHQEVLTAQKRLSEANEEANLYLDIITHDINNVNTGALALTELLLMKAGETGKPVAQRLAGSISQSSEIIANVSTIRKMHERREAIRSVSLSDVIRSEILRFPQSRIRYREEDIRVMADTLLSQVFTNVIGNSVKFAGADAEIEISVTVKPEYVEVRITDNGPGIADDTKPVIFDRFRKGKSGRTGKGLGLFIARTLIESYGGTIWAEDRIPGEPNKGAAIGFTLKRAPAVGK
jgi:signal transduction histidine kinase